ncbi:hypothetical protein Airi01_041150 [Actinoallomurus iriomotensis]|uniref:Uncharacterized protein n=1 Tax=Actinoallomurus iriomotensis TaxID=478107 RepID=A0A9W6VKZ0_9ACTN|nr:hypothetical protein Airi01_041150 [Actinoallomurus iriomotensis]
MRAGLATEASMPAGASARSGSGFGSGAGLTPAPYPRRGFPQDKRPPACRNLRSREVPDVRFRQVRRTAVGEDRHG